MKWLVFIEATLDNRACEHSIWIVDATDEHEASALAHISLDAYYGDVVPSTWITCTMELEPDALGFVYPSDAPPVCLERAPGWADLERAAVKLARGYRADAEAATRA